MKTIRLLLIPAACAALAFSSCKQCKNCSEYTGEDDNGNPKYAKESVRKCEHDLKDAEDAMTDPLIGTSHHKWKCE